MNEKQEKYKEELYSVNLQIRCLFYKFVHLDAAKKMTGIELGADECFERISGLFTERANLLSCAEINEEDQCDSHRFTEALKA